MTRLRVLASVLVFALGISSAIADWLLKPKEPLVFIKPAGNDEKTYFKLKGNDGECTIYTAVPVGNKDVVLSAYETYSITHGFTRRAQPKEPMVSIYLLEVVSAGAPFSEVSEGMTVLCKKKGAVAMSAAEMIGILSQKFTITESEGSSGGKSNDSKQTKEVPARSAKAAAARSGEKSDSK